MLFLSHFRIANTGNLAIGNMTETNNLTYRGRFCQAHHSDDHASMKTLSDDIIRPGRRDFRPHCSDLAEAERERRRARPEAKAQVPG